MSVAASQIILLVDVANTQDVGVPFLVTEGSSPTSPDDLVEAVDNAVDFLIGGSGNAPADAFDS